MKPLMLNYFESVDDGKLYYPLIKFLAELEFNRSYDPEIKI